MRKEANRKLIHGARKFIKLHETGLDPASKVFRDGYVKICDSIKASDYDDFDTRLLLPIE